ncbi:MAG: ATP-binding cassette domain-containing protein, partial [Moraxellaceae bacterium]|nr:ATP-binding cassette domain-containing protein [Moraxellaceae bacterium]
MPSTPAMSQHEPMLSLNNLSIRKRDGEVLVDGINLHVDSGEWLAVVGESGSGKSLSALASLRLLPAGLSASGQLLFNGEDITKFSEKRLQQLRGGDVGMIFQEPLTALNPLHRIGKQLIEMLQLHQKINPAAAKLRAISLLNEVGIDHAERRLRAWPHELSGGQRQRVMIAMALANNPKLLIADEPTTALDALLQIQILDLLKNLQKKRGLSVLFISHDLPQVRRYADRVAVMKAGKVVESADCASLFERPQHEYTRMLLRPFGQVELSLVDEGSKAVLTAAQVNVHYPLRSNWMGRVTDWHHAVQNVGLTLRQSEALGIVGESGSGKSSLAAALLRLTPAKGRI